MSGYDAKDETEHYEHGGEQDVYLLDLAASIFAIMLVYLLIAAQQIVTLQQKEEVTASNSPIEPRSLDFQLHTWRPLNLFNEIWVLHNGIVARIDDRAIAKHYLENGNAALRFSASRSEPGFFRGNVTTKSLSGPAGLPTQYEIEYRIDKVAGLSRDIVHNMACPINTADGSEGLIATPGGPLNRGAACQFTEPLIVHVLGEVGSDEFHFLQELQKAKPSSRIVLNRGSGNHYLVSTVRYQPYFAINKIYR